LSIVGLLLILPAIYLQKKFISGLNAFGLGAALIYSNKGTTTMRALLIVY
jgi:hypothetical protein